MSDIPGDTGEVYEDDFYVVTDDADEHMINMAFVERGMVMRFDYEEFLEFVQVVERTRDYLAGRVDAGVDRR